MEIEYDEQTGLWTFTHETETYRETYSFTTEQQAKEKWETIKNI